MIKYTGFEYLLIDAANKFGLDKELFETRIQWAQENLQDLETFMPDADEPIPYIKAVQTIRDAQKGIPTGHLVGLDACASGVSILSVLTGCKVGAANTGLIDPNVRADLYTTTTEVMERKLGGSINLDRKQVKDAQMPWFYGSELRPKELFGEDTEELQAFYEANFEVAPGACIARDILIGAWQPFALFHAWDLPDRYHVHIPVMQHIDAKVEVDELWHSTFTHRFKENIGKESYLSLAANVTHSVDGLVVREMNRRCNYDKNQLVAVLDIINEKLQNTHFPPKLDTTQFISLNMIDLPTKELLALDSNTLTRLYLLVKQVLENPSFEMITVH